jgi:hypothetical protein
MSSSAFWICDCGRHVRVIDVTCPFCASERACRIDRAKGTVNDSRWEGRRSRPLPIDVVSNGGRRSRAAALGVVCAIGVACGARTELDDLATPADASTSTDSPASVDSPSDGTLDSSDAPLDVLEIADVVEECVRPGGSCSDPGECCVGLCMNGHCATLALYGAPPP